MKQTGQPLIDGGRAIAAVLADKTSIEQVGTLELNNAVRFLVANLGLDFHHPKALNNLKVLSSFWQNNALVQSNVGQAAPFYKTITDLLGDSVPSGSGLCQICGASGIYANSNRTWLPLGGADSDPCNLPSLRGKFLCADCFRCVVLLPLGCRFSKAGPYLFHLTDPELQVEVMKDGVESIKSALLQKQNGVGDLKDPKIRLSGRLELLEIVSGSRLDERQGGKLSRRASGGATIISFSNSGTSAAWNQLHLPAQALDFFAELTEGGGKLREIFIGWAEKSRDLFYDALCDDIENRRSIAPILAALVKRRKDKEQKLTKEEKQVLKSYEQTALNRGERFEVIEGIARRVNKMEERYRERFLKQLANTRDKEHFFALLKTFAKDEKTKEVMRFTSEEYRVLDNAFASEAINLLYLLCEAEDAR